MKTKLFYIFLAVFVGMALASCGNDDVIWDVYPTAVRLNLTDTEGNSLILQDTQEARSLISEISVKYNGETYICSDFDSPGLPSRMILASFQGLYLENLYCTDQDAQDYGQIIGRGLYFGEFQTEENPHIFFTVKWPDGQTDEVELKVKWKSGKLDSKLWVNGKKQSESNCINHVLATAAN